MRGMMVSYSEPPRRCLFSPLNRRDKPGGSLPAARFIPAALKR